ncbi:hypothetical protein LTS18_013012, partial [Coniosporium uncinatum]
EHYDGDTKQTIIVDVNQLITLDFERPFDFPSLLGDEQHDSTLNTHHTRSPPFLLNPPRLDTMASAIFFLDLKGKTLLARNYRGDVPMSAVEKFPILLSEAEEE